MSNRTIVTYQTGLSQYRIPFDYLARPFVVVTLLSASDSSKNIVLKPVIDYRFINKTTIEILRVTDGFDYVQLHRYTSTELIVDFKNGSVLTSMDLTNAELQAIHIAEEGRDQTVDLAKQYADEAGRHSKNTSNAKDMVEKIAKDLKESGMVGYVLCKSFEKGYKVTEWNEVLLQESTGEYFRWDGTLPKTVKPNSTPEDSGGVGFGSWVSVGDASLRVALSQQDGYKLVGGLNNIVNPHNLVIENIDKTPLDSAISLKNKPHNILRFASNNLWTEYSTSTWFGGDLVSPEKTMQLKNLWLKVSADVWGFQEVYTSPTKDISMFLIPPYDKAYFNPASKTKKGFQYGTACMTRLPVSRYERGMFNSEPSTLDHEYRVYDALFLENNVLFINTHLSTDPERTTKMISELASKITEFGVDKVVVVGDMNTRKLSDFEPLEDIGFTLVNKDTWNDIDKILIRGVKLVNSGMEKILGGSPWSYLSDHDLYFVDVEV